MPKRKKKIGKKPWFLVPIGSPVADGTLYLLEDGNKPRMPIARVWDKEVGQQIVKWSKEKE